MAVPTLCHFKETNYDLNPVSEKNKNKKFEANIFLSKTQLHYTFGSEKGGNMLKIQNMAVGTWRLLLLFFSDQNGEDYNPKEPCTYKLPFFIYV